ncbi:MAG: SPOR domain-containing protein [Gammaproteobacteria bacterium]
MVKRIVLMLALFITSATYADSFDVQIGAFRYPDASKMKLPAGVGELRSTSGPNGFTRFVVGPYDTRSAAKQALAELRAAGYGSAFIRATRNRIDAYEVDSRTSTPTAQTYTASQQSTSSGPTQRELDQLMRLTEEERRNVVYLDGRLHKKVGDEFVPLSN